MVAFFERSAEKPGKAPAAPAHRHRATRARMSAEGATVRQNSGLRRAPIPQILRWATWVLAEPEEELGVGGADASILDTTPYAQMRAHAQLIAANLDRRCLS